MNYWHNKCHVLLFHSFLITNVLLQALHSLNSAPLSYSWSGNGSCWGTTPWKTGRKNGFNNSSTQYGLCNPNYMFYRVDRCVTVGHYVSSLTGSVCKRLWVWVRIETRLFTICYTSNVNFLKIIPFILFKCWLSYRVDQEYQILNKKFKWGLPHLFLNRKHNQYLSLTTCILISN